MRLFAPFPQNHWALSTPPRRRRLLPILHHSRQLVNAIHITPAERSDPRGNPRQARANVWSRNRGNPTQFTQLTLAQFDVIRRQGVLPVCPKRRGRDELFQVLREVRPGQRQRAILTQGQFHAYGYRRPLLDFQFPDSFSRKPPRLSQQIVLATRQKIINMCGDGPHGRP